MTVKEKPKLDSIDRLIVGNSEAIRTVKGMINRVASSAAPVLLNGPSGSGKEMIARAIHAMSPRADRPFVAINCGAIPAELIESELFGHEKGSFTGAIAKRLGRFEEADGGTLFLDEIGDMRFDMQVKLLRVLEERLITRVGGVGTIPVDVRIISATHQDLGHAILENRFREDLFFRLGVLPISVPNLSDRVEDIPLLINHFRKNCRDAGGARFSPDALSHLMEHRWPGNVRELRNVVDRASILFPGEICGPDIVDELLGVSPVRARSAPARIDRLPEPEVGLVELKPMGRVPVDLKALIETMEQERIQMAIDMADGVISEAARLLTLKRTTLIEKMRKYGVDRSC